MEISTYCLGFFYYGAALGSSRLCTFKTYAPDDDPQRVYGRTPRRLNFLHTKLVDFIDELAIAGQLIQQLGLDAVDLIEIGLTIALIDLSISERCSKSHAVEHVLPTGGGKHFFGQRKVVFIGGLIAPEV